MDSRVPRSRRFIAAILLVLTTACQTWQATTLRGPALIREEQPDAVRVTLTNGTKVTVVDPTIRNDSIVAAEAITGVASRDVALLEVRRFSPAKTVAFVAGVVVVALTWVGVAGGSSGSTDPGPGPLPKDPG